LVWTDSGVWPRNREIDFPEGYLDGYMCAFLHHQDGTWAGDQDAACSTVTYASWHTAVVEWMPSRTNFYLDGNLLMASTSRAPNTPMHWVLQTDTAPAANPATARPGTPRSTGWLSGSPHRRFAATLATPHNWQGRSASAHSRASRSTAQSTSEASERVTAEATALA
jgi:Glycosyl hydrolases family 16